MAGAHKRPQPLVTRAHVVALVGGLVMALVTLGVIPAATGEQITDAANDGIGGAGVLVALLAPYVHTWLSRPAVTPVADPKNDGGQRLVAEGSSRATVDATVALAEAERIYPSEQ